MEGASGQDYTLTPCVTCGSASTRNEGMVCCNGCEGWFHFRCVGVTESVKRQKKWFCPAELCQQMYSKHLKKQESAAASRRAAAAKKVDGSEKSSARSEHQSSSSDEGKRKSQREEQKARSKRQEEDRILEMERQDYEIAFKARQYAIEAELRERQTELERKMLEKVLLDKKSVVERLKQMRSSFQEQMNAVDEELAQLTMEIKQTTSTNQQSKKTSTPLSKNNSPSSMKSIVQNRRKTPSKEPATASRISSSSESSDPDETSTTSESESEGDEVASTTIAPLSRPTKAQLTARNGITRKLPYFSGKAEEWPLFFSSYTSSTEACGYNDVENLVRLQESLRGTALESVRGQLMFPKLVPKIMRKLLKLYGRPEVLLHSFTEKIRKLQPPKAEKLSTYIPFGNAVEQLCNLLEAAELHAHMNNPTLIQDLVEKLPAGDKREWVRYKKRKSNVNLRTLTKFLSKIVDEACEATVEIEILGETKTASRMKAVEKGSLFSHDYDDGERPTTPSFGQKPCKVCNRTDHRLRFCEDFKKLSETERFEIAKKWKLCHICLNEHGRLPCRFQKIRCDVGQCRERHHPLLHPTEETVAMNTHFPKDANIMFRMIPVVLTFGNKSVKTIAFIDEGASVTLMEKSLADKLSLKGEKEQLTIKWTADISRIEKESTRANVKISSSLDGEKWLLENVRTVSELLLPKQSLNVSDLMNQYSFLRGLSVQTYGGKRPGLLIGLNNLNLIAPIETKAGKAGEPIAVRSKLGWTVYGPVNGSSYNTANDYLNVHAEPTNQELHDLLKFQYTLEESVWKNPRESVEDERARKILETTTIRIGNRFETGLIWKTDDPQFPDSYWMALKRFRQLEKRFSSNPELHLNVCRQIVDYVQKGYAHVATADEISSTDSRKVWYLPLNAVSSKTKPGKTRLVWDAAAQVEGTSLNSQLLKGPDMLISLPAVINRFRERRIAFGADIKEMYHQLQIRNQDKQAQRFLFRKNSSEPIQIYVMDVATFGATCSPCSAQYVKNLNASEFAQQYPEAAAAIIENHYVDDYYDSVDTSDEAIKRVAQVQYIHSRGGFDIRNWVSNCQEVLDSIDEVKKDQRIHFNKDKQTENERVLGIIWNPRDDVFSFSTAHRQDVQTYLTGESRPTKRIVMSCVMGFFDPLGLLTPFTVHGKILIQDLWRTGCDWDETINDESFLKWKRWISLLPLVEQIHIDRCYLGNIHSKNVEAVEIHAFSDASEQAYGCAVYFRVSSSEGVKCSLVMSRTKVAPLKRVSIPRLELMAALLGAKLVKTVLNNHSLKVERCVFWTDSQTALSWIQSDPHKFQQFVSFRISEIQELTNISDWRWIASKHNIADVLTKWGIGPPLDSNSSWFKGPQFLYEPERPWISENQQLFNTQDEMKSVFLNYHSSLQTKPVINVEDFSDWRRLVRVTATVYRFVCNLRRKSERKPLWCAKAEGEQVRIIRVELSKNLLPLQQEELLKAETILWKFVQFETFPDELRILSDLNRSEKIPDRPTIAKSSPLYKLTPIIDTDGIIRMGGRLACAEHLPFDKRFPIILPKKHAVTILLIRNYHERYGHANREAVFNELRQKFYIPGLRTAIQQMMKTCMWCKVYRCCPEVPQMAPLPIQRITQQVGPFSSVGVDYLGPLEVAIGRRKEKRWIAVFTCMGIRAVHLELVYSLTTESCLMALRRFMCKQGTPTEFFSDNGTNFVGAWNEIREKIDYECAESIVDSHIKWNFNPPGTPHMGGIWERMVRSVKEALKAFDDGRKLTDEILLTTLAEAQDMINMRPLTYMPQGVTEEEALTPNHFLRTVKKADGNPVEETQLADALKNIFKRSQYLADKMWQRWCKEYLPSINRRTKWFEDQRRIQKGDLVWVVNNKDRKQWVRGIVEELLEGLDGRTRQVMVRTAKGINRRAVVNLAVFELGSKSGSPGNLPELQAGVLTRPQMSELSPNSKVAKESK
ncbi:uncharacterized protein LOC129751982 [Uranotaenia lowii]|uniref:uncharacterized protein LOC129751982 n=1 Tax=Uranotaenia lowii TaxID=190385 RepID=UPI00247ADCA9|nr:uncharacterized protein LOC129751982 [Uranotaenia lowii]